MTIEESQLWVADQFDEILRASEVERGWMDIFEPDFEWRFERDSDMQSMIGVWTPRICGTGAGQLNEWLRNNTAADPLRAAAKVRTYWEANGWVVSDIFAHPSLDEPQFRADREDGALLGLEVHGNLISIEVVSPCSNHVSMGNSQAALERLSKGRLESAESLSGRVRYPCGSPADAGHS